jgi:hypothetical protein
LFKRSIDLNYSQSKKHQNPSQKVLKILSKNQKDTIQLFSILNQKNIKLDDFARIYLDMSKKKISQLLKLTLRQIQLNKCQKNNFEKIQNWIVMNLEQRKLLNKHKKCSEKSLFDYSFIKRSKFYKNNLVKKLLHKYENINKITDRKIIIEKLKKSFSIWPKPIKPQEQFKNMRDYYNHTDHKNIIRKTCCVCGTFHLVTNDKQMVYQGDILKPFKQLLINENLTQFTFEYDDFPEYNGMVLNENGFLKSEKKVHKLFNYFIKFFSFVIFNQIIFV